MRSIFPPYLNKTREVLLSDEPFENGGLLNDEAEIGDELSLDDKRDLVPLLQAISITVETLHDSAIRPFLFFLQNGGIPFEQPSADEVVEYLEFHTKRDDIVVRAEQPGAIVAGFIRFAEFLSTIDALSSDRFMYEMDDIWLEKRKYLLSRRNLLKEVSRVLQWRFPDTEQSVNSYRRVCDAFLKLVSDQVSQNPDIGVQWSANATYKRLRRLCIEVFGVAKLKEQEDITWDPAEGRMVPAEYFASKQELHNQMISDFHSSE